MPRYCSLDPARLNTMPKLAKTPCTVQPPAISTATTPSFRSMLPRLVDPVHVGHDRYLRLIKSCVSVNVSFCKRPGRNGRPDILTLMITNQVPNTTRLTISRHYHLVVQEASQFGERLSQAKVVQTQRPLLYRQCPVVSCLSLFKLVLCQKQWLVCMDSPLK